MGFLKIYIFKFLKNQWLFTYGHTRINLGKLHTISYHEDYISGLGSNFLTSMTYSYPVFALIAGKNKEN